MGMGRTALLRQVVTEAVLLALFGGLSGVGLAFGAVKFFKVVAGHAIPRLDGVSAGWAVLGSGLGAAVIAAFELSMPDRSPAWAWLPVPPFVLWLASSGYNCWRDWITLGDQGWRLGESAECFGTIIGFSIPLGVALLIFLARAKPLAPTPVAALGGLGVAGLAAFFLDFNHPYDASFLDLGWHAAAIGLVIASSSLWGRWRTQTNWATKSQTNC